MEQSNPFAPEVTENVAQAEPARTIAEPTFLERHRGSLELAAVPRLVGGRGYDVVLRVEGTYTDRNVLPALQRIAAEISAELGGLEWDIVSARGAVALKPADGA